MIDDDADEAELLFEALQVIAPSVTFHSFMGGNEALQFIIKEQNVPDFIFLDLNLPLLAGKEILKKLREQNISSNVPVIIYSTIISKRDIEETEHYSVVYHLQKPDDFETLVNKIAIILDKASLT